MPTLKEYNVKLARLRSTCKLTGTMKLVSAAKLRKAQAAQKSLAEFAAPFRNAYARLVGQVSEHPLLSAPAPVRGVLLLVISSDRGLCGGFNNNLLRQTARWIEQTRAATGTVNLYFCGKRGDQYFRNAPARFRSDEGVSARPTSIQVARVARRLEAAFLSGSVQEIWVAYNRFNGALSQTPRIERLLPFAPAWLRDLPAPGGEAPVWEPSARHVARHLVPALVNLDLHEMFLHNTTGEHAARMSAMDNSSRNARKLISLYTLLRNRVRQAAITRELLEITAGAEALR